MDRSLFPNGVLVTNADLKRVESTKSDHIMRNRVDFTSRGVMSGGEITVNLVNTDRIDVAVFTGYTPRGDYVVGDVANYNISLADSTVGVVNVVCAVYSEAFVKNKPHESDGSTYATAAEASFRISVYTQADFDNPAVLSPTDDNLSNDALDRCLVLGKVTATGGALTLGSIQSPTDFNSILYANPITPPSMPGVDITYVDTDTTVGTGLLEYQYSAPNYELRWTAPGSVVGAWVVWSADGSQTVTDGSGRFIRVYLAVSQMPQSGTFPLSENIEVVDLYGQEIPRQSAEDTLHRNKLGTGIVSSTNPHGMSINDLESESLLLLDEHQDVLHCNGIWKGSLSTVLSTSVTPSVPFDTLYINAPTAGDLFYINGKKLDDISNNSIVYNTLPNTTHMCEVYVTNEGEVQSLLKASYPLLRTVMGTWLVDMSDSYPAGSYDLSLTVSGGAPFVYRFQWDTGTNVFLTEGDDDQVIRLYSRNGVSWIDLFVRCSILGATDAFLPGVVATYTDSITVFDSVDWSDSLHIANVSYWYDGLALQGCIGYPPYAGGRVTVDKRSWGTLDKSNMNDSALQDLIYHPLDEYQYSGVILYRAVYTYDLATNFSCTSSGASLSVYLMGGSCYCRGQRFSVVSVPSLLLTANKDHLVYVNSSGVITSLSVTDSFAGDRQDALNYLLGDSSYRKNVSDSYHGSSEYYGYPAAAPERGVPLWFVTTNGVGVTATLNVMRNVNGVFDPWSVGDKTCAFSSLHSAFYYANCFDRSDITITVRKSVGLAVSVTQPAHVEVRGVSKDSYVILQSGSASSTGSWKLSSGSKVSGISIRESTLPAGNYFFGLNNGVRIENCNIEAGDNYVFADQSVATVNDVVFVGNTVSCEALTKAADFAATTFANWKISNNVFTNTTTTSDEILQENFNNSVISENEFTVSQGSFFKLAISASSVTNLIVKDNKVYLEAGDQSGTETAILVGGNSIFVTGNYVTRAAGSVSKATNGIAVYGSSSNVIVTGNVFENINNGVYGLSLSGSDIDINGNSFYGLESSAITVLLSGNMHNLNISNNSIVDLVEDSSTIASLNVVTAIKVERLRGTLFSNISIKNNSIRNIMSNDTLSALNGISVNLTGTSCSNICICDNCVSAFTYGGSYITDPSYVITASLSGSSREELFVSGNKISYVVSSSSFFQCIYTGLVGSITDSICRCEGNSLSSLLFADTEAINKRSYAFYHEGSGVIISQGNSVLGTSKYLTSGVYPPRAIYVGNGFNSVSVCDNTIDILSNGIGSYYYGSGIYCDITSTTGYAKIIGNKVSVPHGTGIINIGVGTSQSFVVKGNIVKSMRTGIDIADNCSIKENTVILVPGPGPASTDIPLGSCCIRVVATGSLNVSGNTTMTSSDVYTVDGNPADDTWKAYHIYATLNDGGVNDTSYFYVFDSNYMDLKSQGLDPGAAPAIPAMNGLYIEQGVTWGVVARDHTVRITNNTVFGGPTNTEAVFPHGVDLQEPYSIWVGSFGADKITVAGGNTSVATDVNPSVESNIAFYDNGGVWGVHTTLNTNYDQSGATVW